MGGTAVGVAVGGIPVGVAVAVGVAVGGTAVAVAVGVGVGPLESISRHQPPAI